MLSCEEKHPCTESSQQQFFSKTLNRAVTLYTLSATTPLQCKETIKRRWKNRIKSLGFPQSEGSHATLSHGRNMCASLILQNKCQSFRPVQQQHSLNKIGGIKALPLFFSYCRRNRIPKKFFCGGIVGFFVLSISDH